MPSTPPPQFTPKVPSGSSEQAKIDARIKGDFGPVNKNPQTNSAGPVPQGVFIDKT